MATYEHYNTYNTRETELKHNNNSNEAMGLFYTQMEFGGTPSVVNH